MTRPHYQEIADARFDRDHLARMSDEDINPDHMSLAGEMRWLAGAWRVATITGYVLGLIAFSLLIANGGAAKMLRAVAAYADWIFG